MAILFSKNNFEYTEEHLLIVRDRPHVLGWIAGKDRLTELHSDWIKYTWDAMEDRALQAHRGSYKTTAMAVGCIRWMLFNPNDRIAIIRKTFTDAAEVVAMVASMMEMPEIIALFRFAHNGVIPKAITRREGKLVYNFKTSRTPEGNINAHGLDASLTGKHYDKIWMDDFVTLKDRTSKAERDRTKEVLREIVTNIIDPGKPVMFTGTPWHRDDAWGSVPCDPKKFSIETCNILTPEQIEEKRRKTTPFLFAANYLLKLQTDENNLFADPVYGKWDFTTVGAVAHLDAAFDGNHTCALTIMVPSRTKGKIHGVGFVYGGNVRDWLITIRDYCKQYRVRSLYIETNADKGYTADALRKLGILHTKEYAESQNKHIKISTYLYEYWDDIIWSEDTDPEYMNQILDYVEGDEPDDAPDSAASLLRQHWGGKVKEGMYSW